MIISFLGGGNMAGALIKGLLAEAAHSPGQRQDDAGVKSPSIRVADTSPDARERLRALSGVEVFERGDAAADGADVLVLALKPQVLPGVMSHLGPQLSEGQCVVSVAAGITIASLHGWVGERVAVIRTMPNTPAMLGLGITGMYADQRCTASQKTVAERIMSTAGETVWVESEPMIDAVTAISGSGPAYYYLFTEALIEAGIKLGLSPGTAGQLARQTALGAGAMLSRGDVDAATLRLQVTSPGGTTAAAIEQFETGGLRALVDQAATAAARRSHELAHGDDAS